jgi:hypothetical protein
MRKRIVLLAVYAAVAASPSFAEQWLSVWRDFDSVDEHTYEVLLDVSSIKVNAAQASTRSARVKYVRKQPHANDKPADRVAYSITVKSFECGKLRTRLDSSEIHFPDGTMQYVDTRKDEGAWHTARSPAARQVLDFVCADKNPKAEEKPSS